MRLDFLRRSILLVCLNSILFSEIIGNYRICALRVSFLEDELASTTGNGKFLEESFGIQCGVYTIDPPPHDKFYFQSQLKAVDAYFRSVSYGKFGIDLDNSIIYPASNKASYELENHLNYYHPYNKDDIKEKRITSLLKDALDKAYNLDSIDFSNFDQVVIFHAGIGQDFSLPFLDLTPEDIPSTFIDNKMIFEHLGVDGIQLGDALIKEGILLPETQNHLLYNISNDMFSESLEPCDFQYGLTGTFALMLGFAIGLPPLWNIDTGESGIGVFGLMDQGSNNGRGLIPAPPSAWSRYYAGWETPVQISNDSIITLLSRRRGQIVEVPIYETESFFIENRTNFVYDGVSIDSIRYNIWSSSSDNRYPPIVEILFDSVEIEKDDNGVITFIPDYDLGLPAAGLLIWHVDHSVIDISLDDYTINSNINRMGVDLEEADGAQDIGYTSFFLFADPSTGYFGDMWFQGNEEYYRSNFKIKEPKLRFGPSTFPNTSANNGASSFIVINDIGKPGDSMTFSISNSLIMPGFPDSTLFLRSIFDFNKDGISEFIGGKDSLWFCHENHVQDRQYFVNVESDDLYIGYVIGDVSTSIKIIEYGSTYTKRLHYKYMFDLDTMVFVSSEILDSIIYEIYFDHTATKEPELFSLNEWDIHTKKVFFPSSYHYSIGLSGQGISVTNFNSTVTKWTEKKFKYLAGIDLNMDGSLNLLALEDSGNLFAFNSDLTLMPGFPLKIQLIAPVLSRNLIGDHHPEIIGKEDVSNSIIIFDYLGKILYRIASTKKDKLISIDAVMDKNAVITTSAIYAFDKKTASKGNEWNFENGNWGRNRTVSLDYTVDLENEKILIRSYCYPNPIRENFSKIRVESINAKNIELIIYDLAGYFVKKFEKSNLNPGKQVSEWEWDVTNIESGMYFAHVSAVNDKNINTNIVKIAVIN